MKKIHRLKWVNIGNQVIAITVLSILMGLVIGTIDTIFGRTLIFLSEVRTLHSLYLISFLAFAGLVNVFLYQKYGGKSSKGMTLIFEVGHGVENHIPKRLIPLVIVTTWLTHLFGGSAGREGVAVQLGATVSHWFCKNFSIPNTSKVFLVTGMAAGFAGLFQTPLAAVLFAMEVLVVGNLQLTALYPAMIASLVAAWTSHALGLEKFVQPISVHLALSATLLIKLVFLGVLFGLCGNVFAYALSWSKKKAAIIFPNPYKRIVVMGIVLSIVFLLLDKGRYSGLGTNLITASFAGQSIYLYDWFFKLLLTVLTLSAGFQGGEVTPLFAIGASLGVLLAGLFGLPVSLVAALGYAAVFGSATSTFLGPILIGCEVFGFTNFPYFFIVCAVAFSLHRQHSIYGAQKIRY
ncbi:voltage-gated chloride channel family protein [Streptococcus anginosus]|uniref:Chloride transporter, ClC family n=1 Tax=Streptococcus anginosus subsp. whileyi CCUG 39159 TaxID=1095729 RepID=I0SHX3_STRAP|nr:voltage-gated chloride channel family protein [Streptococcus anginosus]AGU83243.1 putative permease, chloride channel [Streptococcus anginosus C238]EID22976.1 chloride transporter, ClC family [Streptococcus anginosus subsp. whileyi CCUG 39159]MDB8660907.1 voltage-gated chloride channel family protein [Streptococcus anginosus]MDP1384893.1 voltage-gated chloride channel family protein [Streptococcus anginosus]QQT09523.1 voltage-gated chloride channel family protein [Streptococcus anginosus]